MAGTEGTPSVTGSGYLHVQIRGVVGSQPRGPKKPVEMLEELVAPVTGKKEGAESMRRGVLPGTPARGL